MSPSVQPTPNTDTNISTSRPEIWLRSLSQMMNWLEMKVPRLTSYWHSKVSTLRQFMHTNTSSCYSNANNGQFCRRMYTDRSTVLTRWRPTATPFNTRLLQPTIWIGLAIFHFSQSWPTETRILIQNILCITSVELYYMLQQLCFIV